MAKDFDEHVEQFRTRELDDAGPLTFVAVEAVVLKGPRRRPDRWRAHPVRPASMVMGIGSWAYRSPPVTSAPTGWSASAASRLGRAAGDFRRARPLGRRNRYDPAGSRVATVSHPTRGEPHVVHAEVVLAVGHGPAAFDLRPGRGQP